MSGKLYIVPTPVGNLSDMTPRAIEVLSSVDLILAEDTRTSGVLLKHFGITTPTRSHHKFNEHEAAAGVVEQLLGGAVMALISMPAHPVSATRASCSRASAAVTASRSRHCRVPPPLFRRWSTRDCPATGLCSRASCRRRKAARAALTNSRSKN